MLRCFSKLSGILFFQTIKFLSCNTNSIRSISAASNQSPTDGGTSNMFGFIRKFVGEGNIGMLQGKGTEVAQEIEDILSPDVAVRFGKIDENILGHFVGNTATYHTEGDTSHLQINYTKMLQYFTTTYCRYLNNHEQGDENDLIYEAGLKHSRSISNRLDFGALGGAPKPEESPKPTVETEIFDSCNFAGLYKKYWGDSNISKKNKFEGAEIVCFYR